MHRGRVNSGQQRWIMEPDLRPGDPSFHPGPTFGLSCAAGSLSPSCFVHIAHYSYLNRNDLTPPPVLSDLRKTLGNQYQKCFFLFSEKPPHFVSDVYGFHFHMIYTMTDVSKPSKPKSLGFISKLTIKNCSLLLTESSPLDQSLPHSN